MRMDVKNTMSTKKRKPLSNITNTSTLIPTSTLRKLVNNSISSSKTSFQPNSRPDPSNRSETSVGSTNGSSRTVQFTDPITSLGGKGSKDKVYSRKWISKQSNKENVVAGTSFHPLGVEKMKEKGKSIGMPLDSSSSDKVKSKEKESCNHISPLVRKGQNGVSTLDLYKDSIRKVREPGAGMLDSYRRSHDKTEKGKAILDSTGCSTGKANERGKCVTDSSSYTSDNARNGIKGVLKSFGSSTEKSKDKEKVSRDSYSFSVERNEVQTRGLNAFSPARQSAKEQKKVTADPFLEVVATKHRGSTAAVTINRLPSTRKTRKRKIDAAASSCPPVTRTQYKQNNPDEVERAVTSKAWTEPRQNRSKKKHPDSGGTSDLPLDFIEQQRAYFKEVDEFELPEEEVSHDELD